VLAEVGGELRDVVLQFLVAVPLEAAWSASPRWRLLSMSAWRNDSGSGGLMEPRMASTSSRNPIASTIRSR